jgi:hypothetical protein
MPRWARLGRKVEQIGHADGLARGEFQWNRDGPQGGLGQKQRKKKWAAKI